MEEKRPIRIIDKDEGKEYVLEFTRETAAFTNKQGFVMTDFVNNIPEMLPILFYGAFRKNHKNVSRAQTDNILFNKLHGLTEAAATRLYELYLAPSNELINREEGDDPNAAATVEL